MPLMSLFQTLGMCLPRCNAGAVKSTAHAEHLVVCLWCCSELYISLVRLMELML